MEEEGKMGGRHAGASSRRGGGGGGGGGGGDGRGRRGEMEGGWANRMGGQVECKKEIGALLTSDL